MSSGGPTTWLGIAFMTVSVYLTPVETSRNVVRENTMNDGKRYSVFSFFLCFDRPHKNNINTKFI